MKALRDVGFGTHVISDQPVVVERTMTFGLDELERMGATCSMGIPLVAESSSSRIPSAAPLRVAGWHAVQSLTPTATLTPTPTPVIP